MKNENHRESVESVIAQTERVMKHTGQMGTIKGLHFECLWCPAQFEKFTELVEHFNKEHKVGTHSK